MISREALSIIGVVAALIGIAAMLRWALLDRRDCGDRALRVTVPAIVVATAAVEVWTDLALHHRGRAVIDGCVVALWGVLLVVEAVRMRGRAEGGEVGPRR